MYTYIHTYVCILHIPSVYTHLSFFLAFCSICIYVCQADLALAMQLQGEEEG